MEVERKRWGIPLSLTEYATELEKSGTQVMRSGPGSFWARYESAAMVRVPAFYTEPVSPQEALRVLRQGRVGVISYVMDPDEEHPANAWLYMCGNRSYALHKLSKQARRDARRAYRSLRIEPIEWQTVLAQGLAAYGETRARVGLSDGSLRHFRDRFKRFSLNPAHYAIGAWKDNLLVAFMSLIVVDDWVAIEGSFSTDAHRGLCPNDGLVHYILDYFLVQHQFRIVSYGLSSIQTDSGKDGLHVYKKKLGFDACPVHRAFVLHPLLRPLVNRVTLWGMNMALRLQRRNRRLNKIHGILALCLGNDVLTRKANAACYH